VLAKAIAKGLTTPSVVLTDTEVLGFLFHPGFSMAKEVTEFSGRGVGMDVVKKNIESLKGRIDLESKFGFGTSFLIRLPMANALTESMLVRVGTVKYVLRVASLRETFRPEPSSIVRLPNGDEMVQLRGRLYPVIRLHQVHSISNSETQLHRGLIMIVENRGRESGLFVDEVIGKIQAVIKPPPNLLKGSKTLAGCSIIGTESDDVALALDINALDEKMAEASKH
jgi:two-component system, chemotaxis family, sensor kinase CheA